MRWQKHPENGISIVRPSRQYFPMAVAFTPFTKKESNVTLGGDRIKDTDNRWAIKQRLRLCLNTLFLWEEILHGAGSLALWDLEFRSILSAICNLKFTNKLIFLQKCAIPIYFSEQTIEKMFYLITSGNIVAEQLNNLLIKSNDFVIY